MIKNAKIVDDKVKADNAAANAALAAKPAALAQKEPEDFNDDEKEAAQAIINNANAATLATNQKNLVADIISKSKSKQDHIDSFRDLSS